MGSIEGAAKTAAVWRSSRVCRSTFSAGSRKSGSSSFNILSNSGMISCLSTKECRRGLQSCRVCRTKKEGRENNVYCVLVSSWELLWPHGSVCVDVFVS